MAEFGKTSKVSFGELPSAVFNDLVLSEWACMRLVCVELVVLVRVTTSLASHPCGVHARGKRIW